MVNHPHTRPFDSVEDLGVAIRTIEGPQQLHIGLLYKFDASAPLILNLRHHLDLKSEQPSDNYRWLQVDMHEFNRRTIVAFCRLIAKNATPIPFGFSYSGLYFTDLGAYIARGLGDGLTCATFVMAIFTKCNIPLLKSEDWPPAGPEDIGWQNRQAEFVRRKFGPFIGDAVGQRIGQPRFLPEQVTAGAVSAKRPLGRQAAIELGDRIRRDVLRSYAQKPG